MRNVNHTMIGKICTSAIGTLALVAFSSNIDIAVAAPLKMHQTPTASSSQDDPKVGTKVRKEVQAIYKVINQEYIRRNYEDYDDNTSTGGCSYFEVKDLTLESLTHDRAELTVIYNRYNCGLNGNVWKKGYIYNVNNYDVLKDELSVTKKDGIWRIGG